MSDQLNWVRSGAENGHVWERGFRNHVMLTTRCANCGENPLNVMREDFTTEPCRGSRLAESAEHRFKGLNDRMDVILDDRKIVRLGTVEAALRHMDATEKAQVLIVAFNRESAGYKFDNLIVAATDMWGDAVRIDRARQRINWSGRAVRMVHPDNTHVLDDVYPTGVLR